MPVKLADDEYRTVEELVLAVDFIADVEAYAAPPDVTLLKPGRPVFVVQPRFQRRPCVIILFHPY